MNVNTSNHKEDIGKEEFAIISSRNNQQLKNRLKEYLENRDIGPIIAMHLRKRNNNLARALIGFISNEKRNYKEKVEETLERLKITTSELVEEFEINKELSKDEEREKQNEYFRNLIDLVLELNMDNTGTSILNKLESGKYRGEICTYFDSKGKIGGSDLHYRMYGLIDLSQDKDKIRDVLEQDISNPSYTMGAYQHLCTLDISNSNKYLHDFIIAYKERDGKYFANNPSQALKNSMINTIGMKEHIEANLSQFSPDDIQVITTAIEEYRQDPSIISKDTSNGLIQTLKQNEEHEEEKNPFKNFFNEYLDILEKRDDKTINKWIIAGLRDHTFHPMPIELGGVLEHPTDALQNFVEKLLRKYKEKNDEKKGEAVVKRIKEQVKVVGQEYSNDIASFDWRLLNSPDEEVSKKAHFVLELSTLLQDRELDYINNQHTNN